MSRKLSVCLSSTMRDLANERAAVCQRLASVNFEPANAEEWLPPGTRTWERLPRCHTTLRSEA